MALLNMHFDLAAYLIEAGADVDKWDLFGRSPIYLAADVSTLPVMGNGAMVVIPSEDRHTALDVGRLLLEAGANPDLRLKRRPPYRNVPQDRGGDGILAQGATALLRAARAGDTAFVQLLLEHDALVDLPSKEGVTPLMAAAGVQFGNRVTRGRNRTEEGILSTMQALIDAGADVNAQMVSSGGGPVFAPSASQRTAGQTYRARGQQVPGPDAVPSDTALHGAAQQGYNSVIELLVRNGADLALKNAGGALPLHVAAQESNPDFLSTRADPSLTTAGLIELLMSQQGLEIPAAPAASGRGRGAGPGR
jgi:ankyrin repeat protein